ncbi:hypothetical protein BJ138DRAFT_1128352 [Hygrophoropsis aurantiaca]|uniref:Uncharacterized protein n=1 Tax=Hygrophoropsis aurantiaca TaxID=72124 RepID=A0ACB8A5F0_9AGAM|nr:hypothetical protein BJ138DRAFT_1128352 [Hygrophoropsis aurantiaca]
MLRKFLGFFGLALKSDERDERKLERTSSQTSGATNIKQEPLNHWPLGPYIVPINAYNPQSGIDTSTTSGVTSMPHPLHPSSFYPPGFSPSSVTTGYPPFPGPAYLVYPPPSSQFLSNPGPGLPHPLAQQIGHMPWPNNTSYPTSTSESHIKSESELTAQLQTQPLNTALSLSSISDWPNGYERRQHIHGQEPHKWKDTKWAWRSQGQAAHNGRMAEKRICLGVIKCTTGGCGRYLRPLTAAASRQKQLKEKCSGCSKHSLEQNKCHAACFHFSVLEGDTKYVVWEHIGVHNHERPPGGLLSKVEEDAVDAQVLRHHDATAYQLRTGDTGPGSIPLPQISLTLANPRAARYQVAKSQDRLGIQPSQFKGGLALLHNLGSINEELDCQFIISSSISGPTYVTLQSPFMNDALKEAVKSWNEDLDENDSIGRHGCVTDGDHTFFRSGNLLVTCVFNGTLNAWIPILYTWISKLDIKHHRIHFKQLFQMISKHSGHKFQRKLLANVMDFSAAQRSAHAEEYADLIISLQPSFNDLSPEAQNIERQHLVKEASEVQIGCDVHFWRSATRLKKNGALVPAEDVPHFDLLIHQLLSVQTTSGKVQNI